MMVKSVPCPNRVMGGDTRTALMNTSAVAVDTVRDKGSVLAVRLHALVITGEDVIGWTDSALGVTDAGGLVAVGFGSSNDARLVRADVRFPSLSGITLITSPVVVSSRNTLPLRSVCNW
jgi:hypothetical protein